MVRRPLVEGSDPKVGPGGVDYKRSPAPTASLDCEKPASLFRHLNLPEVRKCLSSVQVPREVRYELRRNQLPFWRLSEPDEAPECLVKVLSEIPIPREIVFQSPSEEGLGCFAARLDIEANEILGAKMPIARVSLRLGLPLQSQLSTDQEVQSYLLAWVLTAFWDEQSRSVLAKVMPQSLCKVCLGEKALLSPDGPRPVTWP